MNELTREEMENYMMDALCLCPDDFENHGTKDLRRMLEENGELSACYAYNNKSSL